MSEPWSSKVRISSYHLILSSWEVQDLNSSKSNPKNHHSVILDYNMEVYVFHQYFTGEIFSPVNSPVNRWCGEFFQFPILVEVSGSWLIPAKLGIKHRSLLRPLIKGTNWTLIPNPAQFYPELQYRKSHIMVPCLMVLSCYWFKICLVPNSPHIVKVGWIMVQLLIFPLMDQFWDGIDWN